MKRIRKSFKKVMKKMHKEPAFQINKNMAIGLCLGVEIVALLVLIFADYQLRAEIDALEMRRSVAADVYSPVRAMDAQSAKSVRTR